MLGYPSLSCQSIALREWLKYTNQDIYAQKRPIMMGKN